MGQQDQKNTTEPTQPEKNSDGYSVQKIGVDKINHPHFRISWIKKGPKGAVDSGKSQQKPPIPAYTDRLTFREKRELEKTVLRDALIPNQSKKQRLN